MANPDFLRWYRAEARVVPVEEFFKDHSLIPRRVRGVGKIPHEHLLPEEGLLNSRIDAHTSIEGLLAAAGFPPAALFRVLYVLVRSGIMELVTQEQIRREQKEGVELEHTVLELETKIAAAGKNPYAVLGLAPGASAEQLRDAFRKTIASFHPEAVLQHRRLEKKIQSLIDVCIRALDESLEQAKKKAEAPPPAPSKKITDPGAYEVPSIPFANPQNPSEEAQNLCAMAIRMAREGDFASMLVLLEQAQRMAPGDLKVELLLGKALLRSKNTRYRSERHFQLVLDAEPRNVEALLGLAEFSFHMKMYERSAKQLKEAEALQPAHPLIPKLRAAIQRYISNI
jgi:hypothetical protein